MATDTGSRNLQSYQARPSGPGPWPGVVVIHESWGLDEVIRRQADRMAAAGYLAVAPDLFSDGGVLRCIAATMAAMVRGQGRAFADIEAVRRQLQLHPDCTGKVGIVGFCMGGGFALVVAGRGFDAASANYAVLPRDLDDTLRNACPIVASYGAKDLGAKKSVKRLEDSLTRLGVDHDVKLYPRAGHSFLNDAQNGPAPLRPLLRIANIGPEPQSAADAWKRIDAFFAEHLN